MSSDSKVMSARWSPRWRTVDDARKAARKVLPRMVFDYIEGGAGSEAALERNTAAFAAKTLLARRLNDVSRRDLTVAPVRTRWLSPFAVAPMGLNGACRPGGDLILARSAARAGVPFVLSTASTDTIEDVARVSAGEVWFQLYVLDRAAARHLAERAWNADCRTLVLTVDVAVNGDRLRDKRSGFGVPFRYTPRIVLDAVGHPRWALRQLAHGLPELAHFRSGRSGGSVEAQAALMQRKMDASFDWDALSALRDSWRGDLLVKGVLHPDDARRCLALGADGVIVSNHGGRQFEQSPSALDALAAMRASIDGPLLMDSGVRSGNDVLVALALGARAVLIGRPFLYALAAAGEAGVDAMFALLREQFDRALALAGCARADTVGTDLGL